MNIIILSTYNTFGGAAIAASRLNTAIRKAGLNSSMYVQENHVSKSYVQTYSNNWIKLLLTKLRFLIDRLYFVVYEKNKKIRFGFSIGSIGHDISKLKFIDSSDILHLHWISFGFLSIKNIKQLIDTQKPIVWTLHDMWAFTGGCHYSGDCENFIKSCGNCNFYLKNPNKNDISNKIWVNKNEVFSNANITIVACSIWLAELAKKSSLFKNKKIISIPNPIDIDCFKPLLKNSSKKILDLDTKKRYILFGALNVTDQRKGFLYLKEALGLLVEIMQIQTENIELLVFGKANENDLIQLPIKVNFLGQLTSQEKIIAAYNAAEVFVIPSLEENLPNTIMEAMACGTPVVGFNIGGIPEMISHKKTGYLAEYKSAKDLAAGINFVLNEAEYHLLCDNARKKVVDNYSEDVVAKKYIEVYESILNK